MAQGFQSEFLAYVRNHSSIPSEPGHQQRPRPQSCPIPPCATSSQLILTRRRASQELHNRDKYEAPSDVLRHTPASLKDQIRVKMKDKLGNDNASPSPGEDTSNREAALKNGKNNSVNINGDGLNHKGNNPADSPELKVMGSSWDCGEEELEEAKDAKKAFEPQLIHRPKRNIIPKNLEYTAGLSWREENDLKKALYASLQESRGKGKAGDESRSSLSEAVAGLKHAMDESSQDSISGMSSENSNDKELGFRARVHAQRKFAVGSRPGSPCVSPKKPKPTPKKFFTTKKAKTEDFLTFLCLRGTPALPPHLDFYNMEDSNDSGFNYPTTPRHSTNGSRPGTPGTPRASSRAASNCGMSPARSKASSPEREIRLVNPDLGVSPLGSFPLDSPLVAGTSQLPSPLMGFSPAGPLGPRSLDLNPAGWGDQTLHYPPTQPNPSCSQPLCSQRTTSTNPFLRAMPSSSCGVPICSTRMQGTFSHTVSAWPDGSAPVKRGRPGRRKPAWKTAEAPKTTGSAPTRLTSLAESENRTMCYKSRTEPSRKGRRKPKTLGRQRASGPGEVTGYPRRVVSMYTDDMTADDPVTVTTAESYPLDLVTQSTSMQNYDLVKTCPRSSPVDSLVLPTTSSPGYVDRRRLPRELARIASDSSFVNATPAALFDPEQVNTLSETRSLRRRQRPAPTSSITQPQRKSQRVRQRDGPPARNLRGYQVEASFEGTDDSSMVPLATSDTTHHDSNIAQDRSGLTIDDTTEFQVMDLAAVCVNYSDPPSDPIKRKSSSYVCVQSDESTVSPADSVSLNESVTNTVSSGSDTIPCVEGTTDNLSLCESACTGSTESYTIEYSVPEFKDEMPSPVEESSKQFICDKPEVGQAKLGCVVSEWEEKSLQTPSECCSSGNEGCTDGSTVGASNMAASGASLEEVDMDGMPTLQPETSDTDVTVDGSLPPLTAPALECQSSEDPGRVCSSNVSTLPLLAVGYTSRLEVVAHGAGVSRGSFLTEDAYYQLHEDDRPQVQPADSTQSLPAQDCNHPPLEKPCFASPPPEDLLVSSTCSATDPLPNYEPMEETGTSVNVVAMACRHSDVVHIMGRNLSEATVSSSAYVDASIRSAPPAPVSTFTLPWEACVAGPAAGAVLPGVGLSLGGLLPVYGAGVAMVGQALYPLPPSLLAHGHFQPPESPPVTPNKTRVRSHGVANQIIKKKKVITSKTKLSVALKKLKKSDIKNLNSLSKVSRKLMTPKKVMGSKINKTPLKRPSRLTPLKRPSRLNNDHGGKLAKVTDSQNTAKTPKNTRQRLVDRARQTARNMKRKRIITRSTAAPLLEGIGIVEPSGTKSQVTPVKDDIELRRPRRPPRSRDRPESPRDTLDKVINPDDPVVITSSPEKLKNSLTISKDSVERVTRSSPRTEPRKSSLTIKASPRPDRSPETRSQRARADAEQLAAARRLALEEADAAANKVEVIEISPEAKAAESRISEPKVVETKTAELKPETPSKDDSRESSRTTRQSAAREETSEPPPEIVITISPEPPKKPSPIMAKPRAAKPTSPDRVSHNSDTSAMSRRSVSSVVLKSTGTTPRASPTRRLARETGATPEPITKRATRRSTDSSSSLRDEVPSVTPMPRMAFRTPFPEPSDAATLVTAPTYHPSAEQFHDPISYIASIRCDAEAFGMCRIIPPEGWKPECRLQDDVKFATQTQYIHRLQDRWGPNALQLACIRKHLECQGIKLEQMPIVGGVELDLALLLQTIQKFGGINVIERKGKWSKVAEALRLSQKALSERGGKLYDMYCKYLLSYDMLSDEEQTKLEQQVLSEKAQQNSDCIVKGRLRTLGDFYRLSQNLLGMWFKDDPSPKETETEYWKIVTGGKHHVSVQTAHVDGRICGSGFPTKREATSNTSPYTRHGWNFNIMQYNSGSLLKNLGPVSGVSSPTLHISMLFSSACWSCDQHLLPYVTYNHTGADVIWYCIPASEEEKFHQVAEDLASDVIDSDPLWLPEDTLALSPDTLREHGVSLCRIVQKSGQFLVVFPQTFTQSVSGGYNISESLHFATADWIPLGCKAAQMLHASCKPELFSMERLLVKVARNDKTTLEVLRIMLPHLETIVEDELRLRKQLLELGLCNTEKMKTLDDTTPTKSKRLSDVVSEEGNQCEISGKICYLSMVVNESQDRVYSLEHALPHLQKKKNLKSCKLIYRYEESELQDLLQHVRARLTGTSVIQKKRPSKHRDRQLCS